MNRPDHQPQPLRVFGTDTTTRRYIDPAPVIETPDGTLRVYAVEIESTNPGRAGLLGFPLTKRGYVSKHPRRVEVALDWLPAPVRELVDPENGPTTVADTPQPPQEAHNTPQAASDRAALAEVAQAAHKLSQAICDWLDLKEDQ